jgi:two-component system response regulator MtrA
MGSRILLVEDDRSVSTVVTIVLQRAGFDVDVVTDGRAAVDAALRPGAHDAVLLDLMLPGLDGFEVCRRIRARSAIPIIMVTARDDAADVVAGLELGGDDYVTKPFDSHELVARIRAVLRRSADARRPTTIEIRDLRIDTQAVRVVRGDAEIVLSVTEFKLLAFLAGRAGEAIGRDDLVEHVWGHSYLGDSRLVDMAVLRLRDRLGAAPEPPPYISTVRGVGYRFECG